MNAPIGQKIRDILLATPADDLIEELALLAFAFECEARQYHEVVHAALGQMHQERVEHGDELQRLKALLAQIRRDRRNEWRVA